MITQKYTLDLVPGYDAPVVVRLSQFDTISRKLAFSFTASGAIYSIPTGAAVTCEGMKPDGKGFSYEAEVTGDTATITVRDQMTVVAGRLVCQMTIRDDGEVLGTANFIIDVEKTPVPPDADLSESEIDAMAKVLQVAEAADTIINSVSIVKASIEDAKDAKTDAESAAASAEEFAKTASSSQVQTEAARDAAVEARAAAQDARDEAVQAAKDAKGYPELTADQKKTLQTLMTSYLANRSYKDNGGTHNTFIYEESHDRNSYSAQKYAISTTTDSETGEITYNGFKINCVGFVQLIMMGRDVADYIQNGTPKFTDYSPSITQVDGFDGLGYYADFKFHGLTSGLKRSSNATTEDDADADGSLYFKFKDPYKQKDSAGNRTFVGSYSYNTYYSESSSNQYKQNFNEYTNANDLALELYEKGCEIPLSEVDVGDIVFFKAYNTDDESTMFNKVAYRNITHVAMVYEVSETNGKRTILSFMESSGNVGKAYPIDKASLSGGSYDIARATYLMNNIVMCARIPTAFGIKSNLPSSGKIEYLYNAAGK